MTAGGDFHEGDFDTRDGATWRLVNGVWVRWGGGDDAHGPLAERDDVDAEDEQIASTVADDRSNTIESERGDEG